MVPMAARTWQRRVNM